MRDVEKLLEGAGLAEGLKNAIYCWLQKDPNYADLYFNLRRHGFAEEFIARIISEYCELRLVNKPE